MASKYEYITISDLVDALPVKINTLTDEDSNRIYSDDEIESQITRAEKRVNLYCLGQIFTGTIPDGVEEATLSIARKLWLNILWRDNIYTKDNFEPYDEEDLIDSEIEDWLDDYREEDGLEYASVSDEFNGYIS